MLPSLIWADAWAADYSQGDSVLPGRNGHGTVRVQPLTEKTKQDVFLAARILLAQQYLDPQTRLVDCPVAFLQRNLHLPYRRACRLSVALEKIGDWSPAENNCRTIYWNRVS